MRSLVATIAGRALLRRVCVEVHVRTAAAPPQSAAAPPAAAPGHAAGGAGPGAPRRRRRRRRAAATPAAPAARRRGAGGAARARRAAAAAAAPPAVMPAPVTPIVSATAPTPDPRVGLKAGRWDAAQAAWNMRLVSTTPPPTKFLGVTNSDLAFTGKYAIQGNYNGFQIFDISNPAKPTLALTYVCPASQSDVSVYKQPAVRLG